MSEDEEQDCRPFGLTIISKTLYFNSEYALAKNWIGIDLQRYVFSQHLIGFPLNLCIYSCLRTSMVPFTHMSLDFDARR